MNNRQLSIPALLCSPEALLYFANYSGEGYLLAGNGFAEILTDFRYVEQAKQQSGLNVVQYSRTDERDVLQREVDKLGVHQLGFEAGFVTVDRFSMFQSMGGITWTAVDAEFEQLRAVKDKGEVELIRKCAQIQDASFEHMKGVLKAGITEREAASELEYFMRKNGADSLAFSTIIASGENGAQPHATVSDRRLQPGDMVTMDYGCCISGYRADITRTVSIEYVEKGLGIVYNIVLKAQMDASRAIRPGMVCSDIDKIARDYIAKMGYGECFGHSLGHSMGLKIHERPAFSPEDRTVLKAGMVISVEPGIYLPGKGGVRIEDTVLVTGDGCERLTKSPRELCIVG